MGFPVFPGFPARVYFLLRYNLPFSPAVNAWVQQILHHVEERYNATDAFRKKKKEGKYLKNDNITVNDYRNKYTNKLKIFVLCYIGTCVLCPG